MTLDRIVRWRGLELETLEHCHVVSSDRDTRIRGVIVAPHYGLSYRIKLDDAERVRTVRVERTDGRIVELFSDGAGNWTDDRAEPLGHLRGCLDIDIWPTPLTNSLPLWRQSWADGDKRALVVAWIDADEMTVAARHQTYERLDLSHFRFSTPEGFERVLSVDDVHLVVGYPGLFERI
jgi:hypothetical protein